MKRPERPERLLDIPLLPSTTALKDALRHEGEIIKVPTQQGEYGLVAGPRDVPIKVSQNVINLAHHRASFKRGAIAEVTYVQEGGDNIALKVNTVRKRRAVA